MISTDKIWMWFNHKDQNYNEDYEGAEWVADKFILN